MHNGGEFRYLNIYDNTTGYIPISELLTFFYCYATLR